jgi:hypothetical protein
VIPRRRSFGRRRIFLKIVAAFSTEVKTSSRKETRAMAEIQSDKNPARGSARIQKETML